MRVKVKKQIEYLLKITDKYGVVEHCVGSTPDYDEGWCVDDNARAIQVCLRYEEEKKLNKAKPVYFGFLKSAWKNNRFYNDLNPDMSWKEDFSDDGEHAGRALVALGEIIGKDELLKNEAKYLFDKIYSLIKKGNNFYVRVMAQVILGLKDYEKKEIDFWANKLVEKYQKEKVDDWRWFEPEISYDNGRIPLSLLEAYKQTNKKVYLEIAIESLDFLTSLIFKNKNKYLSVPGNKGWFTKSGIRAEFDQQPIEAGTMVEVYVSAYKITKNKKYKELAIKSFGWYLGKNIRNQKMIDDKSGGIYDGFNEKEVNSNQGAESLLSYLIAAKEIEKIGSPGD